MSEWMVQVECSGSARRRAGAGLLALALVLGACRAGMEPSEDYAEASRLYAAALAERGLDAHADPRMARILELCDEVPGDSLDADAARSLAGRVRAAQAEARAFEERIAPPSRPAPSAESAAAPPSRTGPLPSERPLPPLVGAPEEELFERYGDCLQAVSPFVEKGGTRRGTAFALASGDECRGIHPDLEGLLIFVADARVFNVAPREAASLEETRTPDPAAPAREEEVRVAVDAPAPVERPPAGPEEAGPYVPGMPVPEGVDPRALAPMAAEPAMVEVGGGL